MTYKVQTYINKLVIERRLLEKETMGGLLILIKNIYTLYGRRCRLYGLIFHGKQMNIRIKLYK